jgi:hypothetical protein
VTNQIATINATLFVTEILGMWTEPAGGPRSVFVNPWSTTA